MEPWSGSLKRFSFQERNYAMDSFHWPRVKRAPNIYVDDIIFGSNDDALSQAFSKLMQSKFEMSMLRELSYFLGLQIS